MRRVLIISFDALEHSLVEQFQRETLMQEEYGKVDLTPYFEGGGYQLVPLTDQIYPTFISGRLPKDHHILSWLSVRNLQEQKIPTLFDLPRSLAINVPVYSFNTMRYKFLHTLANDERQYRGEQWTTIEKELEDYETNLLLRMLSRPEFPIWRKHLLMVYFVYTDILGHAYGNDKSKLMELYVKAEELVLKLKERFDFKGQDHMLHDKDADAINDEYRQQYAYLDEARKKPPIVLIYADHGMLNGHHTRYGFYSLSEPLGWQGIKVNEFYHRIVQLAYGP